ncbi:hypothetical protein AB0F81_33060 [Actinoplanes sp. NPDC024001]|uniref:hypothetical protein n=1 Tax=Actinoplanes sp. NPDC024001 TaxID=3154598 RepID=UPI0033E759FE
MAGASDNNGWPPDGGTPDDLPDLPEEWGVIVIPDDLSELSDEVDAVRAELHTTAPLTRWQRFRRRPAIRRLRRIGALAVRTPALIISMAILVTVASLFASAWPGPPRQPATQRTAGTTENPTGVLPALEMIGPDGQLVSLTGQLPAVVLLTDGCACDTLVADTVAGAGAGTAVLIVSAVRATPGSTQAQPTARTPQAEGKVVTRLHDQTDSLRKELRLGAPDGTAAVLLVDRLGKIAHRLPRVASAEMVLPYLPQLSR